MSAWLMAVYFKGLDEDETIALTKSMLHSGEVIDLSDIIGKVIDKHSTGGVGDKTSLIVAPLVAAAGIPVAKMSGRGLSHTGGTIDKLESIPGFETEMSKERFINQVKNIGIALCGQTANLVPADKKIYALRDVTATVNNVSLIASSIMSKKLASGADGIVIDIKVGDGAFLKTTEEAENLALLMRKIAGGMGKSFTALLTSMQQPLGFAIGNALEVEEAISVLKGNGPNDLKEVSIALAAEMLILSGSATDIDQAKILLNKCLDDGSAYQKMIDWAKAQNGDVSVIQNPQNLAKAKMHKQYVTQESGYISQIKASHIGMASMELGAGRSTKEDTINMATGIVLNAKVGDYVDIGDILCTIHYDDAILVPAAENQLNKAFEISKDKPSIDPIIIKVIR
jgi:pyrimidine-nucleoside phosphorylase